MKKRMKKLVLNRETLGSLTDSDLPGVLGARPVTDTCGSCIRTNCESLCQTVCQA